MTERKPYPTDARNEEWGFVAPYLILFPLDAGQRRHDWRYVVGGDFGSVRNFVFEAVLGILAPPQQGKNPQGSSRHRAALAWHSMSAYASLTRPTHYSASKRFYLAIEMKMFAPEQLHSGVEMLMLMGGMLYLIRQTLYSAGEMLHPIGG